MEENQTTTVMQDITGPPPPPATSPPFDALQKPAQLVNDSPVGPLDAPFETVEPLADPGDRRAKTWARARVALIIGAVVAFVGVGAYALIQRAGRTSPSQASNFNTVSLPLTGLGSAGLAATGAGSLTVNGVLRVTDSLVLTPIAQPTNPQTGQIFFDKLTSQLAYYNGQDFVNVAGVTTNNTSNTTNVTRAIST